MSERVCARVNNTEIDIVYYNIHSILRADYPFGKCLHLRIFRYISKIYVKRCSWHASFIALVWYSKMIKNTFTYS